MEDLDLNLVEERRRKPRPLALPPGLLLRLDVVIKPIVAGMTHPLRGLALLVLLILVCSIWTFWTLEYRLAPLQARQHVVSDQYMLTQEVAAMEAADFPAEIIQVKQKISRANARILPNYTALAEWLHTSAVSANELGIIFEYHLQEPQNFGDLRDVSRIPVSVTLKVNVQSADKGGYRRLLEYLYQLDQESWTKEINRAAMQAENGGAKALELAIDLWMRNSAEDTGPIGQPGRFETQLKQALSSIEQL